MLNAGAHAQTLSHKCFVRLFFSKERKRGGEADQLIYKVIMLTDIGLSKIFFEWDICPQSRTVDGWQLLGSWVVI